MTKYLWHVTMQTGSMRKSPRSEVDKRLMKKINALYEKSVDEKTPLVIDRVKYIIWSTAAPEGYMTTLAGEINGDLVPIWMLGVSLNDYFIWEVMHQHIVVTPIMTKVEDRPPLPYLVDRLESGYAYFPQAMEWVGDFSRCMAWAALEGEAFSKK